MTDRCTRLAVSLLARLPARDEERGASLVEYALLVVMIAVICAAAIGIIGKNVNSGYSSAGSGFN